MRVHVSSDHAGLELKTYLVKRMVEAGHEVVDHGPTTYVPGDDYPDYCIPCAQGVVAEGDLGVVLGGSGNGEQIAANLVPGCRAILAYNTELAALGRLHNNANVVALGARFTAHEEAWEIVKTFLSTDFTGEERHARRIQKMTEFKQGLRPS